MVTLAADPECKRLKCLLRHIEDVRNGTEILAGRLIENGEFETAKTLIQNGFIHDSSKFQGIEWESLNGQYADRDILQQAIRLHATTNAHHPEYWGDILLMPRVFVAEMVCDWAARSSEFGSDLRAWISNVATKKYEFSLTDDYVGKQINEFLSLLLEPAFS